MKIPLMDLWAQHRALEKQLVQSFRRSLRRSDFILGDELAAFEAEFARKTGARAAIGVGTGTDALRLSLIAAGVGRGDEVIVPAQTFAATAYAVTHVGARPKFVDIEPDTSTIDPAAIEAAITSRTRAIIPVHLYGHPADMTAVMRIARRHGLVVIEDACQAHGALWRGRPIGSIGTFAAFSFYPSKNLGALGDGGIITTSSGTVELLHRLRNVGQLIKNRHDLPGFNCRLDTMQAAFLRHKLRKLEAWNRARRQRANWYRAMIRHPDLRLPVERPGAYHVYHVFVTQTGRRDSLQRHLRTAGIASQSYYPTPVPLQPAMRELGYKRGAFPVAERSARENLALPMFPELSRSKVEYVARVINRW